MLVGGVASAVLAGCAAGGSALDRPAMESFNVATYPVGAYRGTLGAEALSLIRPAPGSASYDARDRSALAYVSNLGASEVEVFRQRGRAQRPIATITYGITFPDGLTTDSSGNLYVADSGEYNGRWVVQRYAPGRTSPSKTYATDLSEPTDTAVADDGTIYIANFHAASSGWVAVYPKGEASKEYRLADFRGGSPLSLALDVKQNLYVVYALNNQGSSAVNKYAPGAKKGENLHLAFSYGAGIQVDPAGNVLVVQQILPSEILVFRPGKKQPSRSIFLPNGGAPYNIALSHGGKLLFAGDSIGNVVDRFAYPSGNFEYPIAGGFNNPVAVTTVPSEF